MSIRRRQSTSKTAARRWQSRIRRFLLACFCLQLIIVGAGLYYTDNLDFIFTKKNTVPEGAALEKDNPVEEKDTVISEINQEEALPPVLTSSPLQVNHTAGDAADSRTEGGGIEESEEITTEISSPESQEQVSQESGMIGSRHQQQVIPVISHGDESATVAEPATEVISQETSGQHYYTVQSGDTLGLISREVYGTYTQWRVIANANTDQLGSNPNILRPGMELVIPTLAETGAILLKADSSASLQKIE